MNDYEIWLGDPRGNRLALLDRVLEFSYVNAVNTPGAFSLKLPGGVYDDKLREDCVVEIWRQPEGGALGLDYAGFVRAIELYDTADGDEITLVGGYSGMDLLTRRIVAYYAETAYTEMTDQADDMCKEIVRDNLGSDATDTDRDWSALNFTVAGNLAAGPSITKAFAWQNVLEVLQEIAETSATEGTELFFDVVPVFQSDSSVGWRFETYTGQIGPSRGIDSDNPLYIGTAWGTLSEGRLSKSWRDEATVVYAGGQGNESERNVNEVEDATRSGASPWGRREAFVFAADLSDDNAVTARANARLAELGPAYHLTGRVLDTPQARYGPDWRSGTRLVVEHRGIQADAIVRAARVDYIMSEEIDARIEVDL